ncbi:hypothetical protein LTR95_013824 [Oleoguttula sp. CCFEE 5521]
MAVPLTTTAQNFSGTYTMNKTLGDSSDEMLKMQNIGWIVRKVIANSAVTTTLKQYTDDKGLQKLDLEQLSTGGMKTDEERVLDWEWRDTTDKVWGKVKGRARLIKVDTITDPYLKEGWSQDCLEGEVLENEIESLTEGWKVLQIWGFAEVDGKRRQIRRVRCNKDKKELKIRLVYDWQA